MGRACGMYEGMEGCIELWWGKRREREHLEDTGVDERVTLKWIF